jgi:hypothetical protein
MYKEAKKKHYASSVRSMKVFGIQRKEEGSRGAASRNEEKSRKRMWVIDMCRRNRQKKNAG